MTVKFCGVKRSHDPHYFTPVSDDGLKVAEEVECLGWYGPDKPPTIADVATFTITKETHDKIQETFRVLRAASNGLVEAMAAATKTMDEFRKAMENQNRD